MTKNQLLALKPGDKVYRRIELGYDIIRGHSPKKCFNPITRVLEHCVYLEGQRIWYFADELELVR